MFSATSLLLVLACASAVSAVIQCSNSPIGVLNGFAVQLQTVQFTDALTDVKIPVVPQCVNGESGVLAQVCDHTLPEANFVDYNNLIVKRTGSLDGVVTVTVTVFCKS